MQFDALEHSGGKKHCTMIAINGYTNLFIAL